ncbi:iron chelate uptake ABC transporter family permease subunit [Alkalilimnicola sp. S0819]|uniref:iron chelate uptake ABC transporter family permease subunit n=1 Tax=Alkalilimnicola sp. S0819 TaxID=2613922 RepID=UPI0012617642|nr:iron chelate uptake ABC transporter family permease subunit [Alkalilimnicola sp. S0819]KAB7627216.1 iron chelate uptake ABC transporter family permease subunit [Alkalilimnicola sp. S0819]MPQ15929.1 iron chelate uptake ABC transporter family permease subunit [Alkalilimnicola sp. S0819]
MDDFLLRALSAGLGLALVAGPLGSFVVWRRMAYFGDTLAHAALLGVVSGFLLGLNLNLGVLLICVLVAVLMVGLKRRRSLADDTLLGILSHSSLALGLVALGFMETLRVDLMGYLFGDILAVSDRDLWWIALGGLSVLGALAWIWRPLLLLTIDEELAVVEGVRPWRLQLLFAAMIAVVVAIAMKMVGVLLVTSLLIIPAAAARAFARSPEQMAALAALIGCLAVLLGLAGSWWWNLPSGPAVVVAAAGMFFISNLAGRVRA